MTRAVGLLIALSIAHAPIAIAREDRFWCFDLFDSYRNIKCWAIANVSVSDYKPGSGDASYLRLTKRGEPKKFTEQTADAVVAHFRNEFVRVIKGNLPFHDTDEGREERITRFYEKYGSTLDFVEKLKAYDEAYRNSTFGSNPGGVFCTLKIVRRDFPVLYESTCSVVADKDLYSRGGLEVSNLGYSTPELIEGEIKRIITDELEELGKQLVSIRSCK